MPTPSDALDRQRRNLFIASITLALLEWYGLKDYQSLTLLGATFEIPQAHLRLGIWVIYGYFFLRFLQFYNEGGGSGLFSSLIAIVADEILQVGRMQVLEKAELEGARMIEASEIKSFQRDGSPQGGIEYRSDANAWAGKLIQAIAVNDQNHRHNIKLVVQKKTGNDALDE